MLRQEFQNFLTSIKACVYMINYTTIKLRFCIINTDIGLEYGPYSVDDNSPSLEYTK